MNDQPEAPRPDDSGGEQMAWSVTGTLVSGPVTWGLIGFGVDQVFDKGVFLPLGLVLGFVFSIYVVYLRYGRD